MLRVGLTGGVASGKSVVGRMLAERGAALLDADRVVAGLYDDGRPGAAVVADLFGGAVLAGDGSVDRRLLGERVLADEGARRRLEARVHPLVRAEVRTWFDSLTARPEPPAIAVVEAALLVETGSFRDYDALVVVAAPVDERRARALAAGWSVERFERTVAAQASDRQRAEVADHVLMNGGDLEDLEIQVERLWRSLLERAARAAIRASD